MSYEADTHKHQMIILRHLLLQPDASFSDLQKKMTIESDAASFHIKQLIQAKYVNKLANGRYGLSQSGK